MSIQPNNVGLKNSVEWNSFANFAAEHGDKTIVKVSGFNDYGSKNEALQLDVSQGDSVWKFRRSKSLQNINNDVRQEFKDAVFARFGLDSNVKADEAKLPPGVKKAMNLSDFNGKGKPLTVRQIKAVDAAIKRYQAECGIRSRLDRFNTQIKTVVTGKPEEYKKCFNSAASSNRVGSNLASLNGEKVEIKNNTDAEQFLSHFAPKERIMSMQKALLVFCSQDALPFSQSNPLCIGGLKPIWPKGEENNVKSSVAITKSFGGGYDIVMKQEFSNILKMADPTGKKKSLFFRPDKPLSYGVTYSYHLKMSNGYPVVSLKKQPMVEVKRAPEMELGKLKDDLVASLWKNEKGLQKVDPEVKSWLDSKQNSHRTALIDQAFKRCVDAALEDSDGMVVTGSAIAEELKAKYEAEIQREERES